MKYIYLSADEPDVGSECCLAILISRDTEFKELSEFYQHSCQDQYFGDFWSNGNKLSPIKPAQLDYFRVVKNAFKRHCNVDIDIEEITMVYVVSEDWNIHDYCFNYQGSYYRYAWLTAG